MPRPIPESTKRSLHLRLLDHQARHWPQLATIHVRFRAQFAYVDADYQDGTRHPLCRLRYQGSASQWGFAIWRASIDGYDENVVPIGLPVGTPEDALETACGLYVGGRIPLAALSRPHRPTTPHGLPKRSTKLCAASWKISKFRQQASR